MHYLRDDNGCWVWQGKKTAPGGYGQLKRGGRTVMAHRYLYELAYGPIPDGLHIDHRCRNKSCVNPEHLEAVRPIVNTMRSQPRLAAACGWKETA